MQTDAKLVQFIPSFTFFIVICKKKIEISGL